MSWNADAPGARLSTVKMRSPFGDHCGTAMVENRRSVWLF